MSTSSHTALMVVEAAKVAAVKIQRSGAGAEMLTVLTCVIVMRPKGRCMQQTAVRILKKSQSLTWKHGCKAWCVLQCVTGHIA